MDKNALLRQNKDPDIINKATIYIRKRTVQFGPEVYQVHNIAGFGITKVKRAVGFPIQGILGFFVIGLITANFFREVGILIVILAILALIANLAQRKEYGLGLYLNSGHEKVFITTDLKGLTKVVAAIYEYMDSEVEKGTYVVNVVEGNVTGNFVGGNARGTITLDYES